MMNDDSLFVINCRRRLLCNLFHKMIGIFDLRISFDSDRSKYSILWNEKILSQLHSVCTSHILDIFFSSSVLFFFSISNTVWTLKYHTQHNYFNDIFSVHVSHTNIFYSFTVMHLTVYPLQMKNTHCNNDDNI